MEPLKIVSLLHSESKCKAYFKRIREKQGISCHRCGHKEHYWKCDKSVYECKACRSRQSLRSGTVMENSKLPYRYWLAAIYHMGTGKKAVSAPYLQRLLGHKRYEPIWYMMQKVRMLMGKSDSGFSLQGEIETDGASLYVKGPKQLTKTGKEKRAKVNILFSVEAEAVEPSRKHKIAKKIGKLKMTVLNNMEKEEVEMAVKCQLDVGASVTTDAHKSFHDMGKWVRQHTWKVVSYPENTALKHLPVVHIMIGNFKNMMIGIYHSCKKCYVQNYADEFCYKFNRRYTQPYIVNALSIDCISNTWC
jgi:hypothetical protein